MEFQEFFQLFPICCSLFREEVSSAQVLEDVGRDKFVGDTPVITADNASQDGDGFPFSFFGIWPFEGHA